MNMRSWWFPDQNFHKKYHHILLCLKWRSCELSLHCFVCCQTGLQTLPSPVCQILPEAVARIWWIGQWMPGTPASCQSVIPWFTLLTCQVPPSLSPIRLWLHILNWISKGEFCKVHEHVLVKVTFQAQGVKFGRLIKILGGGLAGGNEREVVFIWGGWLYLFSVVLILEPSAIFCKHTLCVFFFFWKHGCLVINCHGFFWKRQ